MTCKLLQQLQPVSKSVGARALSLCPALARVLMVRAGLSGRLLPKGRGWEQFQEAGRCLCPRKGCSPRRGVLAAGSLCAAPGKVVQLG